MMRNTSAFALFSCGLAACTTAGSEASQRATDTAARRDSIAAVATAAMNENQVAGLLAYVHVTDSALGALGIAKGSSSEVKDFARMIVREHRALHKDAGALARELGVDAQSPTVAPDEAPTIMRDSLIAGVSGAAWDLAYMEYAIAVHNASMENIARALAASKRPEVKKFVEKSVPILQKHLDKARSVSKQLPAPKPTPAPKPNP